MTMHDSGKRQQFEGGAVRDTAEGKPQYSLLSPYVWPVVGPTPTACIVGARIRDYLIARDVSEMRSALNLLKATYGLDRLCEWLRLGAEKYDRFNWAKGMPITRCLDSLGRHMSKWDEGDEDHIAAVMCNIMFIIHYHCACEAGLLPAKWMDLWDFDRNKEVEFNDNSNG